MAQSKYNSNHPMYGRWKKICSRCTNPNTWEYEYYGARGITICEEWGERSKGGHGNISPGFINFMTYIDGVLDPPPTPEHNTLDRIDNQKGYEPGNIKWATRKEQANNRRPRKANKGRSGKQWISKDQHGKWIGIYHWHGEPHYVGYFVDEDEAFNAVLKHRRERGIPDPYKSECTK